MINFDLLDYILNILIFQKNIIIPKINIQFNSKI